MSKSNHQIEVGKLSKIESELLRLISDSKNEELQNKFLEWQRHSIIRGFSGVSHGSLTKSYRTRLSRHRVTTRVYRSHNRLSHRFPIYGERSSWLYTQSFYKPRCNRDLACNPKLKVGNHPSCTPFELSVPEHIQVPLPCHRPT